MKGNTRRWLTSIAPALVATVLVLIWYSLGPISGTSSALLPAPIEVLSRLLSDLGGAEIWPYLGVTAVESIVGCFLGAVLAIPLAVGIHRSKLLSAGVQPYLGATQAIPGVALAPLLVLWVGYGLVPVIFLCAIMAFFPILISTLAGLRLVPRELVDAALIDGASSMETLFYVESPLSLPNILAGIKNAFAISVTGAVVGEMVMGGAGLGMVLTVQRDAADSAGMFATIILMCTFSASAYSAIALWERHSITVSTLTNN